MKRLLLFSALLVTGMIMSQLMDLTFLHAPLHAITLICLSYIMIEVGLEFSADFKHPMAYAKDAVVASAAAALPWVLCALYFLWMFSMSWKEASLVACFAAPTSAGILFTLLAAAGLSQSWLFKKARVLAIFDDLATLLLLIPLQIAFVGWKIQLLAVVFLSVALLYIGFRWINHSHWPIGKWWVLLYAAAITGLCHALQATTHIPLEVLLPSFALGCVLRHQTIAEGDDPHSWLDQGIKGLFMLLVGSALPAISLPSIHLAPVAGHVLALTCLANAGKCLPFAFYQDEATWRQRLGLSIAMFPRGEVGASVLLLALNYGITGMTVIVGSLSLALNLLLTGLFIMAVKRLAGKPTEVR